MAQHYRFDKEKASRKPGITPLKEAIDQMLDKYRLRNRFDQSYVVAHWDKIMGTAIGSRTKQVYIRDRILFLQIESAPLRNELVRAKSKIIELINREMKTNLVEDVVFI
jgi:predicted nucleic acid-binding Zn ribbon protein